MFPSQKIWEKIQKKINRKNRKKEKVKKKKRLKINKLIIFICYFKLIFLDISSFLSIFLEPNIKVLSKFTSNQNLHIFQ